MTLEEILQQSEVDRMLSGNVRPYQNHAFEPHTARNMSAQENVYNFLDKYVSTQAAKSIAGNKGNFGLMDLTGFSGNAERIARNTGRGIVEGNYGDVALGFGLLGLDVTPAGKIVKPIAKGVKKLGKKIKKISGSPYGVFKKADETKAVNKYVNTVKKGISGSDWYEKGGKSILKLSDDNPKLANKFAENLATTSAGTGVSPNLAFSIKGHNQAIVGDKIITGRFPKTMGKQIDEIYNTNKYASGQKRIPFADQLATGGEFYSKKSGQANRAVHDIWDGRAWGYTNLDGSPINRAFAQSEHRWMDNQMNKVINKLNKNKIGGKSDWTAGQAQAASWTGAKIDAGLVSPNNAAFSYKEAFPDNYAFQSREAIPGIKTGHMKGLINEPLDVRQAYDREVTNLLYDKQGRDKISKGVGLLTDTSIPTTGYFKGQFNPSRQSKVAVGREKGTPFIDASSEKLLNATEGSYGLLTAQDAAAWHYLAPNKVALKNSTIAELNLGKTLSQDQAKELNNINKTLMKKYKLKYEPIAVAGSDTGVRLIDTTKKNSAFNKNFAKEIKEISSNFGTNANDIKFGTGSSNYFEMNKYVKNITAKSKSKIIDSLDNTLPGLANEMNKLDIKFAKEYGYDLSPVILTIRKAISTDGLKGLTALIASGAVPSVVASEITPLLEKHDN